MNEKFQDVTSAEIKELAKRVGADCVGIAPMSRWEGAPKTIIDFAPGNM